MITTVLLAALVAAVALLSLVLVGVVRRLREHELALDRLSGRAPDPGAYAGQKINPADLGDEDAFTGVVGFFFYHLHGLPDCRAAVRAVVFDESRPRCTRSDRRLRWSWG